MVFFDVDGTLLPGNSGSILGDTLEALKKLQANGHKAILSTGRHPNEVKSFSDFPFDGYVLLNGQLCLDREMKPFFINPIAGKDKEELLKIFHGSEVPLILVELDIQFMNFYTEHVQEVQDSVLFPYIRLRNITEQISLWLRLLSIGIWKSVI